MLGPILHLTPKRFLSRVTGYLVHLPLPAPLSQASMKWFANRYKIDLSEAEHDIGHYKSIGDLFVRRLKPGLRPLGAKDLVHPADSRITQMGSLEKGDLIQAKGKTYRLREFLGALDCKPYEKGAFATYYLCPTDYHRVHSPVTGKVRQVVYIPGALWPVNEWSTSHIDNLFSINERVVVEIETEKGLIAVVLVGATNVGQMSLAFWPEFRTNAALQMKPITREFGGGVALQKGDELGAFHMGSTVVMCLSAEALPQDWNKLPLGHQVRVRADFDQHV
ncbi:MAG: phosphatidylserine decarboxylase [Bdellovibrionaceae bacterium]|nr:phosphatidylserine decarboxylase [Pseudobdellovibrionaceae bacterium]